MKRFSAIVATVALLVAVSAPAALAAPGNGTWWDTSVWNCDEGLGDQTLSIHYGIWSTVHVEGMGHLILTGQKAVLPDNSVLYDMSHPGHTNPGPIVTCTVTVGAGYPLPDGTVITIQGFLRP